MLCKPVTGATYGNKWAFEDIPSALGFSMANNLLNLFSFGSMGLGTAVLAPLSDRVGRKRICAIALAMTVAGYVATYLAGTVIKSYWAYCAASFVGGFFTPVKILQRTPNFCRLNAPLFTATVWILIPAYCFAIP